MFTDGSYWLSVSEAFALPVFEGCKVVGGFGGLDRRVAGVNVADIPDYYNWVKPGELLVTNCFGIRDDPEALNAFIPTLSRLALAGVCIKPHRFIDEITPEMLRVADALDFPIIELPMDVVFVDIAKSVFDALLTRQTGFAEHLRSINDTLVSLIAGGSNLDEVAQVLSELVGNPVLIVDTVNDRSALGTSGGGPSATETPDTEPYSHMLEVDGRPFGFVYVYPTDTPVTQAHIDIIEMLSKTIPLEIARERSVRATGNVQQNDFILHLLNDPIVDERRDYSRAETYGLDLSRTHIVIRLLMSEPRGMAYTHTLQRALLYNDIKAIMREMDVTCIEAREENEQLLILNADGEALCAAEKRLEQLAGIMRGRYAGLLLNVGYGLAHSGAAGLAQSGREAKTALKVCVATQSGGAGILGFGHIGLYRLIYAPDPDQEIRAFINETLGPVVDPAHPKNTELLPMLEGYIRYGGNLKKLSEATFTHYNTVVYRLRRVKELTGLDMRNHEDRFKMETAINLYRLLKIEESR